MTRHAVYAIALLGSLLVGEQIFAAPPPALPGEEITDEYLQLLVPQDSIKRHTPVISVHAENWLDEAMKSWDAVNLNAQLGKQEQLIPMGKGALLLPLFTESNLEPDIEVIDSNGTQIARGKPGESIFMLPGTYFVMFGSGTHQQAMVRRVVVEEGKTVPLIPDWAGLSIEVVNEDNFLFRGEYELVRIDKFEPYGRGFGPDPDLGEKPRTWVLQPGLYKLFSVGESYNTNRNFITVQLLPGRLAKVTLVQDETDYKITGGGIVDIATEKTFSPNWQFGADVGGSAMLSAQHDRRNRENSKTKTTTTLLLNGWVRYEKKPYDWYTSIRLDEGFSLTDWEFERLANTVDDARLRSLFIWRIFPWAGPYGRLETEVNLFAKRDQRDEQNGEGPYVIISGTSVTPLGDTVKSLQTEQSLSPMTIETGVGANIDVLSLRFAEIKLLTGFGYTFKRIRQKYLLKDHQSLSPATVSIVPNGRFFEWVGTSNTHQAGPEAGLTLDVRLGRLASAKVELQLFAPFAPEFRLTQPDADLETTLSWRLARGVTLDYIYSWTLDQNKDIQLRVDKMEHRVQLRYSFSSR